MIQAEGLTKRYRRRGRPALTDLHLAIPPGQLYGLVGPDGAGKTTTLRILATVITPSEGTASVAGYDVIRQAKRARHLIGYMPQAFSLYPDLTVRENLDFFADVNEVPAAQRRERIPQLLHFARLEEFQSRRSAYLSGGMRKKLALACALVHAPRVLLLDEPTTGVDPVSRRELWRILAEVVQQGVTILISTPYMDEAERCHQVGMIYEGRLLISGPPTELEQQIPFTVLEVIARPRRIVRQVVQDTPGILHWRPVGDRLRLAVSDAAQVQAHLAAVLPQAGATVRTLRPARPTMEDAFVHLVEAQRGAP
ncbi:MAG: ABC transporter ATP-binding protein [Anaerolineae bacterium]|nr:ABC transporter ATP-binding protein [Anaerolineae bacterium]